MHRNVLVPSFVLGLVLVLTSPGSASSRLDETMAWLRGMAGPSGLAVESTDEDIARQTVHLHGVRIGTTEGSPYALTFDDLSVEVPRIVDGDLFTAHALRGSGFGLRLSADLAPGLPRGEGDAAASATLIKQAESLLVERLSMPMRLPDPVPAGEPEYRNALALAHWLQRLRADWIEADNLTTGATATDGPSFTVSAGIAILSGVKEGRIERVDVSSIAARPDAVSGSGSGSGEDAKDSPPLVRIDGLYAIGLDLAAALEVIDPAAYVDGHGDGRRRDYASEYGATGIAIETPAGDKLTLGSIEFDGIHLRQTESPLLPVLADLAAHPEGLDDAASLAVFDRLMPALSGLVGLDLMQLADFAYTGKDGTTVSLGGADLNAVGTDGIGALTLRDIATAVPKKSAKESIKGSLDLLTFQNIRFGSLKAMMDLASKTESGETPSPIEARKAILDGGTTIGFIEADGLKIENGDKTGGITTLAITNSDFLGALPRRVDLTVTNLNGPVDIVGDSFLREELTAMGYDRLSLSGAITASWDTDRGDIRVGDLRLVLDDMAALTVDLRFGNLPLDIFDDPASIEKRMMAGTIGDASIVFGNLGVVEKAFDVEARKVGQEGDAFRKNIAGAIPLMMTFLKDPEMQKRFAPPIRAFLEDPKSLTITMKPRAPVPFSAFEAIDTDNPDEVIKLLNLDAVAND